MKPAFSLLVTLALAACQPDETISGYAPVDTVWVLQRIDGALFEATATIQFPQKGQVRGMAPCNSYSAQQNAPYPWLDLGPILSTKRACPELEAEQQYLAILSGMSLIEVSGDTLILSNDADRQMLFKAKSGG